MSMLIVLLAGILNLVLWFLGHNSSNLFVAGLAAGVLLVMLCEKAGQRQ